MRALARLEDLEAYIGSHAAELARPREFIASFVGQYVEAGQRVEPGTMAPEALDLEPAELEVAGRILVDARRSEHATLDGLVSWCLRDLPAPDQRELCTPPPHGYLHGRPSPVVAVANGTDPAVALAERRKWDTYEADFARLTRRALTTTWTDAPKTAVPALTFGSPEWVAAIEELEQRAAAPAPPVDSTDPRLVTLTALRDVILRDFAGRDRVAPMARWTFRDHPRRDAIAWGLANVAGTLSYVADVAGMHLSKLSADLRSAFLVGTRLAETEPSELVGMGLAEVGGLDGYFPGVPAEELVDVALDGQIDALAAAIEVAGWDAREWAWVKLIEEALIFVAKDVSRSAVDRKKARSRVKRIADALAAVGRGDTEDEATRERRAVIERDLPLLRAQQKANRKNKNRRLPLLPEGLELLERGYTESELRNLHRSDDVDALLADKLKVTDRRIREIRRRP
jgi:hypothetical protein